MWACYWEATHSQSFPRQRLGLLVEGTTCSIIDHMQALMVSGRASGLKFHCHLTFFLKVCQTHATCTNPTELDFVIHRDNWLETFRERRPHIILIQLYILNLTMNLKLVNSLYSICNMYKLTIQFLIKFIHHNHFKSVRPVDNKLQFSMVCTCLDASDLSLKWRLSSNGTLGWKTFLTSPKHAYDQLLNKYLLQLTS